MSFRRGKIPAQTRLPLVGCTFESTTLEPFVSLLFRNESDSTADKVVLMLVVNVSMRDSSETGKPTAIWKGDSASADVLEPLVGQVVHEATADRHGQIEVKFDNGHTLFFEPEAEGEWRLHKVYRDKVVFSKTWSDGGYIT